MPQRWQAASEACSMRGTSSQAQHVFPYGPEATEASILVGLHSTYATEHDRLQMPSIAAPILAAATQAGSSVVCWRMISSCT